MNNFYKVKMCYNPHNNIEYIFKPNERNVNTIIRKRNKSYCSV